MTDPDEPIPDGTRVSLPGAAPALDRDDARVAPVLEALATVWDPELGIDVVNLGLIYGVRAGDDGIVVEMTLTTPGCPVSESLPVEVEEAVAAAVPDVPVHVEVVWDPPWTPERLSPEALETLGYH